MPQVKKNIIIQAPFEVVWQLARDVEKLPTIMPDLEKVEVIEQSQVSPTTTRVVSQWHSRIKQFNRSIVWTEEDLWDEAAGVCHFWQLKGDFTEYKGEWRFREIGQTTEMDLSIDYSFEIPLVGAILKSVMQKLMQQNVEMMSNSIKVEGEKRAAG